MRASAGVRKAALAALLAWASGCSGPLGVHPGPVVRERKLALSSASLQRVAVLPFFPSGQSLTPLPGGGAAPEQTTDWQSAALVSNFVAEALAGRGIPVIPPSDVEVAFAGEGFPVPRQDPRAAAQLAQRSFGATSVVLGRVLRWRDLEGSAAGAMRPASIGFEVSLHEVPTGRRLWTGRFDETQQSLSAALLRAREYPGGGTRWLTAAEFARWGADQVAKSLIATP